MENKEEFLEKFRRLIRNLLKERGEIHIYYLEGRKNLKVGSPSMRLYFLRVPEHYMHNLKELSEDIMRAILEETSEKAERKEEFSSTKIIYRKKDVTLVYSTGGKGGERRAQIYIIVGRERRG